LVQEKGHSKVAERTHPPPNWASPPSTSENLTLTECKMQFSKIKQKDVSSENILMHSTERK